MRGRTDGPPTPVAVVVVAYGSDELLEACLAPLAGRLPVVVVDNASSATCRDLCARLATDYVDPGANLGFAAGVNLGLEHLPAGHHVLLLNPDARLDVSAVTALGRALDDDRGLACVSPTLVTPDTGAAQRVAWPFPTPGRQWLIAAGLGRLVRAPDFLVGAALMLHRDALAEVGPLDERFFLYAEETDWQRRAAAAGWRTAVLPAVSAEHVGGATSTSSEVQQAHFHAATEIYVRKWFGPPGWAAYRAARLAGDGVRWLSGGERRPAAADRLRTFARGPVRHRTDVLAERGR